ncbi:MAG: HlyD family efflux transporter periplasmic adaptor subunit, partial [Pseudomonadota bacterium]
MSKPAHLWQDSSLKICAIALGVGLGGFLLWSLIAPLDEGVVAAGQLVVAGDRKEIAHFEGGIVRAIHVAEGDRVEEGESLITLEPVQSETARDEIAQELLTAQASMERLTALRLGVQPLFELGGLGLKPSVVVSISEQQQRLFEEQQAAFDAEMRVLETRQAAAEELAQDLALQIKATGDNLRVAKEDFGLRSEALKERLETVQSVQRAEREVLELEAELARLKSEQNSAMRSAEEAEGKVAEENAQFRRTVEEETSDVAAQVLALSERLTATDDRLLRTELTAPLTGVVLGLEANTVGGVVRAGEKVMEIVPDGGNLVALLKLPPT